MKKKLFLAAITATAIVSTAMTTFAADTISGNLTVTSFFSKKTDVVELESGNSYTFKFHNKSNGTNAWENYVMAITGAANDAYVGAEQDILIIRADSWGWGGELSDFVSPSEDGNELIFETNVKDWDAWKTAAQAGFDCEVTIKREGNTLIYTAKTGDYTSKVTATSGKNLPETCYVFFTGENCSLTGFTTIKNGMSSEKPEEPTKPEEPDNPQESEISGNYNITTFFGERTNAVKLKSGDTYTFKFHNKSNGTNAWENYVMAITGAANDAYVGAEQDILIIRADSWGWGGELSDFVSPSEDGNELIFETNVKDWDAWKTAAQAGFDCEVTIKREGNTLIYTAKTGDYTSKVTATSGKNLPETCYVFFTGENCSLTGFTTIKNGMSSEKPENPSKPDSTKEPEDLTGIEVKKPTYVSIGDEELNVAVSNQNVPEGAKLTVSEVKDSEELKKVEKAIEIGFSKVIQRYIVLDLNMMVGTEKVQPLNNGAVVVTMDIPSALNTSRAAIYRMETDGSLSELKSTVKDGKISFETKHFSTYIIAEKDIQVEKTEELDTTIKTTEPVKKQESPKTGDTVSTMIFIAIIFISCVAVVISRKREIR